jgi:hypothetical protein
MDANQDREVQASFDGYVPQAELEAARAEIKRLQAGSLAWELVAKMHTDWEDLPEGDKVKALETALAATTVDFVKAEDEIERLRADNMATLHQHSNMAGELVLARDEIKRLWAALSWIEDQDPQIVDAARTKFNLEQDADDRERAREIKDGEPRCVHGTPETQVCGICCGYEQR